MSRIINIARLIWRPRESLHHFSHILKRRKPFSHVPSMRRLSIHDHVGVFMRTFPRPNSSPFRARVCRASIKVLFYVPSRKWRIPFFLVLLLASKLMVEASADFHNFKGNESLSGRRFGISLFFLLKLLEKFDCYNAPWCVGKISVLGL